MLNSIQFELWKNCCHNCDFCFNIYSKTSTQKDKRRILRNTRYILETKDLSKYCRVGYIGGELLDPRQFDDRLLPMFKDLIQYTAEILDKYPQITFYITTALLFEDLSIVEYLADFISKQPSKDRWYICTSFDTCGRFHNEEQLNLFYRNMRFLQKYDLNIHVEVLPTQHFIETVLADKFNPREFEKEFNCKLDYSDLNSGFYWKDKFDMQKDVPYFFPKRADFIRFLKKCYAEDLATYKEICYYDIFFNEWYRLDEDLQLQLVLRHGYDPQMPYGNVSKSDYIDSDKLMYQDVNEIWEIMKGKIE